MFKKANQGAVIAVIMMIALIAIIGWKAVLADNASFSSLWRPDVQSGTDIIPGCDPKKYIVKMLGTLDLINQKQGTWTLDYDINILDAHITDIDIDLDELGFMHDNFDASICLYDVLAGYKATGQDEGWKKARVGGCVEIADEYVVLGQIEKFPFSFQYDLYDNDCNGLVDDHSLNLVVELETEDGEFEQLEKSIQIVNGKAAYQNAWGY